MYNPRWLLEKMTTTSAVAFDVVVSLTDEIFSVQGKKVTRNFCTWYMKMEMVTDCEINFSYIGVSKTILMVAMFAATITGSRYFV